MASTTTAPWYTDADETFNMVQNLGYVIVAISWISCVFVMPAYGRFADDKFGVSMNPNLGWFLMELPATLSFLFFYAQGPRNTEAMPLFLAALWCVHYGNRGFYFPYNIRNSKGAKSSFSFSVISFGWVFTAMHGYLNAKWFSEHGSQHLNNDWFYDPRFIVGFAIYEFGFWATIHCESIMRNLRDPKVAGPRYKIPRGGAFEYITGAQYATELIAWTGFAILTWGPGGVIVLTISMANLIPRAFATHKWYLEKFGDEYPKDRKVIIPFIL